MSLEKETKTTSIKSPKPKEAKPKEAKPKEAKKTTDKEPVIIKAISWYNVDFSEPDLYDDNIENVEHLVYLVGNAVNPVNDPDKLKLSVRVKIKNFKPFYYILLPDNFDTTLTRKIFKILTEKLNSNIKYKFDKNDGLMRKPGLESFHLLKRKKIFPYTAGTLFNFMKLTFSNMKDYTFCKYVINKQGIRLSGKLYNFEIYESKVDVLMKFFHNRQIQSTGYIKIEDYEIDMDDPCTDISIMCDYTKIEKYEPIKDPNDEKVILDPNVPKVMPLKIMSVDIETQSNDGESFPNPTNNGDYIGIIGITTWIFGTNDIKNYVITRGKCDPVLDTTVYEAKSEKSLLIKFCDLVKELDPDIITGYNTWRFDENYISIRMDKLGISSHKNKLSRLSMFDTKLITRILNSGAYGNNEFQMFDYILRDTMDLLVSIKREHKLDSYTLDNVAFHFLEMRKDDLHPTVLFKYLASGKTDEMAIAAKYCIKDTYLVIRLLMRLCSISNSVEMAETTFVPNNWLLYRGQQCKIYSLISKYGKARGFLIPDVMAADDKRFTGATVLEPMRGAYYSRVAGLDFASLYPSIMIAHNLCYSTIVLDEKYMNLPGVAYETIEWLDKGVLDENNQPTPYKFTFVQDPKNAYEQLPKSKNPTHSDIFKRGPKIESGLDPEKCYQGILPAILMDLKEGRTETKRQQKKLVAIYPEYKENTEWQNLEGKQLSQKITMNSAYGFTGVSKGMMPCKQISACVTSRGRDMIIETKNTAEELYNCTALYGDSIPGSEYVYVNYDDKFVETKCSDNDNINTGNSTGNDGSILKGGGVSSISSSTRDKSHNSAKCHTSSHASHASSKKVAKTKIKVSEIDKYTGVNWTEYKPMVPFLFEKGPSPEGIVENKEQLNLENHTYTTLSGSGPTKIQIVIRHKTTKKLYRIKAVDSNGNIRTVVVTEGHSLVTDDDKLMEAGNLKVGTLLKELKC